MASKNVSTLTETYKLPSLGLLYSKSEEEKFPEEVTIRSMTTFEEKMRLGNQGFWKTMCGILDSVITSPEGFVSKHATLFDFYFLMYKMRVVSYGPTYKVQVTCPYCNKTSTIPVDLDSLEVKYLDENLKEPFKVGPLPRSKDTLECRFMRVLDSINNEKKAKDLLSKSPDYEGDPSYIFNMASKIVSINGEEKSPIEVQMYVEKMQAMDSAYFNQAYSRIVNQVGMSTQISEACPHCGEVVEFNLPFNSEFFRPTFDF